MALKQSYPGKWTRPHTETKPNPRPAKGKPISPQRAQRISGGTVAQPKGGQPRKGTQFGMGRNAIPKGGRR